MTGLTQRQLTDLVARAYPECGDKFVSRGRPMAVGLFRSVAMVVCLLRKNPTQEFVGAVFGVSQSTVSRRWDLLRTDAIDMPGAQVAVAAYCPNWWPASTRLLDCNHPTHRGHGHHSQSSTSVVSKSIVTSPHNTAAPPARSG